MPWSPLSIHNSEAVASVTCSTLPPTRPCPESRPWIPGPQDNENIVYATGLAPPCSNYLRGSVVTSVWGDVGTATGWSAKLPP